MRIWNKHYRRKFFNVVSRFDLRTFQQASKENHWNFKDQFQHWHHANIYLNGDHSLTLDPGERSGWHLSYQNTVKKQRSEKHWPTAYLQHAISIRKKLEWNSIGCLSEYPLKNLVVGVKINADEVIDLLQTISVGEKQSNEFAKDSFVLPIKRNKL